MWAKPLYTLFLFHAHGNAQDHWNNLNWTSQVKALEGVLLMAHTQIFSKTGRIDSQSSIPL